MRRNPNIILPNHESITLLLKHQSMCPPKSVITENPVAYLGFYIAQEKSARSIRSKNPVGSQLVCIPERRHPIDPETACSVACAETAICIGWVIAHPVSQMASTRDARRYGLSSS